MRGAGQSCVAAAQQGGGGFDLPLTNLTHNLISAGRSGWGCCSKTSSAGNNSTLLFSLRHLATEVVAPLFDPPAGWAYKAAKSFDAAKEHMARLVRSFSLNL